MHACFEGDANIEFGSGINAKVEIGLSNKKNKATLGGGFAVYAEGSIQGSFSFNEQYVIARQKNLEQIQAKHDYFNTKIKKYSLDVITKISSMGLFDFGNHEDFDPILMLAEAYSSKK